MQFANLFPKNRSTVITFYSGAFSASAIIFVMLKYAYDAGLSFGWVCSSLVVLSLAMVPITFFLLPADQVREEVLPESLETLILNKKYHTKNLSRISAVTLEKYKVITSPRPERKINMILRADDDGSTSVKSVVTRSSLRTPSEASDIEVPLRESLTSLPFTLHQWWYSWLITYMIMYVGTMNLWLQRVTSDM